jgi:hypothetical protein
MKNFNSLVNLIHQLHPIEISSLRKFVKYQTEKNNPKTCQLLELIIQKKEVNAREVQLKIYKEANYSSFNKLVERLKIKVLDVILLNNNIDINIYSERSTVNFDLRKKLIQSDMLSSKGLRDDADHLCRKIITKAIEYEFYDITIQALRVRQRFMSIRKRVSEVNRLNQSINSFESKNESSVICQQKYNSVLNLISNARNKDEYIDKLVDTINFIQKEYEQFRSNLSYFYLNMLQAEYYQLNDNFLIAENHFHILNALLKGKSVFSDIRTGTVLLNFSNNNIQLGNYNLAIKNAIDAKPYFFGNVINISLVEEQLFYAYFYLGDIDKANQIITGLINNLSHLNLSSNIYKWNYFLSAAQFSRNDYIKCIEILTSLDDFLISNDDLKINKRLLLIICKIQFKEIDGVDVLIESLGKYIKRISKRSKIRSRYIFILQVLTKLANSNYNFNLVHQKRRRQLNLLESDNPDYAWKPKEAELIVFNKWFKSMMTSRN